MPDDDRFILTPAHRVQGPDDISPPEFSVPEFPVIVQPPLESPPPLELTGFIVPDAKPENDATDPSNLSAGNPADLQEADETDALPPLGNQNPISTTLEMRIAELEVAVDQSGNDWEPDGSEPETGQGPGRHIFEVVDNTHFIQPRKDKEPASETPLQLADVAVFTHFPGRPAASAGLNVTEKTVEEAAVNDDPTSAAPKPKAPDPEAGRVAAQLVDNEDDVFVDEDILRRVVAEVVREELQGKMGERITRNVRRMVRREIEHTLSLKEFD
ncbi:MAG: hypothetical protein KUG58_06550 [Marinosulfonomonas sp.]|nr:hypothetical protein [Marinosulfonomonas sp.]